jgi:hypothetical protein
MAEFTDEDIPQKGAPIYLGILGSRADGTQDKYLYELLGPMLQELGRVPDKVILPSEGISSIYISDWADSLKIPNQMYEADWRQHQRRAKIFRDSRIQNEATHFLVFLNKRSEFNEKMAIRLARKGYMVFTVGYNDWSLEQLTVEQPLSSQSPPLHPAGRGSKRGTGKEPERPQLTLLKYLETQDRQTDPWVTCTQTECR